MLVVGNQGEQGDGICLHLRDLMVMVVWDCGGLILTVVVLCVKVRCLLRVSSPALGLGVFCLLGHLPSMRIVLLDVTQKGCALLLGRNLAFVAVLVGELVPLLDAFVLTFALYNQCISESVSVIGVIDLAAE